MLHTAHDIAGWPPGSDGFVEAFAKGLAVVGVFGPGRTSLTIAEIAQELGLPRAGVRRLLLTLTKLGLARQDGARFSLTPRVLQLGFAFLSSLDFRERAQPVIEALAREVGEVVAVSVLDGPEIVFVARAEVQRVLARNLSVGARLPAFCTSMGRVLLADQPNEVLEALLAGPLPAMTRHTKLNPEEIRAELAKVRELGWALVSQELELGVIGIAVPVRDRSGAVVAAVNLSSNLSRHSAKSLLSRCLPLLLAAAQGIVP